MENTLKIKKIGIPRAISYYNNFPFYYGFFKELGTEVVISEKTSAKIIKAGSKHVVSETCFPIKVYVGHLLNLLEKGCEAIFVPSLQSVDFKINNCSKIRGLPEIIRNVIKQDFIMIEPTLDKTEKIGFKQFWTETANTLGVFDKVKIQKAIKSGWKMYDDFIEMTHNGVPYEPALKSSLEGNKITSSKEEQINPVSVVIMGHGYNLFDERISMNVIKKLEKMGVNVYTSLNVSREDAKQAISDLGEIQYWANELDLTGTAGHYILKNKTDGIIALSAFGCGPDSLMVNEIEYHCKNRNLPIIHLTVDEHTGEAGFVTRLEAFVDMLLRKKRNQLIKSSKKLLNEQENLIIETKSNLLSNVENLC